MAELVCQGWAAGAFCQPFSYGFMQRALLAGLLTVVITSLVGTWVVLRGLSFMGDALAHGVVPGVALAVLLGFDAGLGAVLAAVVMVVGINLVHRLARGSLTEDTGIGLLFVGMLALGVIILSRTESYAGNLADVLFGDVLGVSRSHVLTLAWVAGLVVASLLLYRAFLVLAFNEDKAELLGLRPRLAHLAMLGLITLAVVASLQTVGTLLVFGLLIAPPAAGSLVVRRVPVMMVVGVGVGALSVVGGLLVSFHAGTAASATMAGTAVALFFAVLLFRGR